MPNDFMGPPEATEDEQLASNPLAKAFAQLDSAGSAPESTGVADVFKDMIPVYGQIRSTKRRQRYKAKMHDVSRATSSLIEQLVVSGMDVEQARAVAWMQTARRLRALGFQSEADLLQKAGLDNLAQWKETVSIRSKRDAEAANQRSLTRERDEKLEAGTETWVKFARDGSGRIEDWQQVFITDDEIMRDLAAKDYIAMGGNLAAALNLTAKDFATTTPPSENVMETIIGGFNMLNHIRVLRAVSSDVGFSGIIPEGPLRTFAANMGITALNNQGFVEAVASRKKMRADVQSLIKGIPSNYDAGVFEALIPDPGAFKGKAFYNAQVDVLETETKNLISLLIAFHKGSKRTIPPEILGAAKSFGITPGTIESMSDDELQKVNNNTSDNVFRLHEQKVRSLAEGASPVNMALDSALKKIRAEEQ